MFQKMLLPFKFANKKFFQPFVSFRHVMIARSNSIRTFEFKHSVEDLKHFVPHEILTALEEERILYLTDLPFNATRHDVQLILSKLVVRCEPIPLRNIIPRYYEHGIYANAFFVVFNSQSDAKRAISFKKQPTVGIRNVNNVFF